MKIMRKSGIGIIEVMIGYGRFIVEGEIKGTGGKRLL